MNIAIVGSGYVGLVSGTCLADFGHRVTCVDKDAGKIADLNAGRVPIFEPGLEALIAKNVAERRLSFTTDLENAVADAEVVFIAVGTPSRRGDGHADLSFVYEVARSIAACVAKPVVVCTKSTVPVGTGDEVERIVSANPAGVRVEVVSNPEFLREGAAISDFKRPDRIVVGVEDEGAREVMARVYRPLYLNEAPLLFTRRRTAELIKYAANAFLAMKITFINEVADLCEAVGADVQEVARGIGLDNRIGGKFLHAGPGYGGSCFPKDTLALIKTAADAGSPLRLIETTAAVNEARKAAMGDRIIAAMGGDAAGKTVALLGLTFKPNTDDMRDAPSLAIVEVLQRAGATVRACDPEGAEQAGRMLTGVEFVEDPYAALTDAHAAVVVTEWDKFRALDLARVRACLAEPLLVDLRNIYRPQEAAKAGLRYVSIGRPDAPR